MKRQELLKVAAEVFAQKGFHGGSMEEIAKAAEYATGALYRYFASKEVLYTAVLEQKIRELVTFVKGRAKGGLDPLEMFQLSIQAQFEFADANRAFIQIYYRERMEVTRAGAHWQRIDELLQEFVRWRAEGMAAGQKRGLFRAGDPVLYVLALDGMINGFIREWMARETSLSIKEQVDFMVDVGLRGILAQP